MKILSKIFFVLILLGFTFLNTTCNKKAFTKITWQGYVYDTINGKPVEGVWISLNACDAGDSHEECSFFRVGQSVSDAKGHFYIHNEAARSNRYEISVNGLYFSPHLYTETSADILKIDTIYLKN
jgi:protocatechuate 3,4-dioxygenase beta subunit